MDASIEVYSGRTRVMYDGTVLPTERRRRGSDSTEVDALEEQRAGPSTQRKLDFQTVSPGYPMAALANELAQTVNSMDGKIHPENTDEDIPTFYESNKWEDEDSEGTQWDEPIPQRNKINYRWSRSLSQERKSSSHAREHVELAGRKSLILPGYKLKGSIKNSEPEYMQKIFLVATGPTSDEILDMPNTCAKAKQDMLAEQKDACQKALALILCLSLPVNKNRTGRFPTMGDIFQLRKEVLIESNNQIYNRKPLSEPPSQEEDNVEDNLELDEEENVKEPEKGIGISLAEIAASSAKKKRTIRKIG